MLTDGDKAILRLLVESGGEVHRLGLQARGRLDELVSRGHVHRIACDCCGARYRIAEAGRLAAGSDGE